MSVFILYLMATTIFGDDPFMKEAARFSDLASCQVALAVWKEKGAKGYCLESGKQIEAKP